jgi:FAD/FMN-containing dehydrogenase
LLLPENGFDVARALVGSEGTLVTVLHAELELVKVPAFQTMLLLGYPSVEAAGGAVAQILPYEPWQLEGLDDVLINLEHDEHTVDTAIREMPAGRGWLSVQFAGTRSRRPTPPRGG